MNVPIWIAAIALALNLIITLVNQSPFSKHEPKLVNNPKWNINITDKNSGFKSETIPWRLREGNTECWILLTMNGERGKETWTPALSCVK